MKGKEIILILTCLFLLNCQSEIEQNSKKNKIEEWSYMGETAPEHWAEIEETSNCDGIHQSPVNIIESETTKVDSPQLNLNFYYAASTKISAVENNGHSIQFDFEKGDSIIYNETTFELIQLHFHEPSEHTINGLRYPIELHFVHRDKQNDFAVVSVLGYEGKESQCFEFFRKFLPLEHNTIRKIEMSHDLTSLFPTNKSFYAYQGSLTTPPCTENVSWLVFKNPIQLSVDEVLSFKKNMPLENYRDEQSLNGRQIYYHSK